MSKMRHSLSDESTRAATAIGSWMDLPYAIPQAQIVQEFKDKSRRMTIGCADVPKKLLLSYKLSNAAGKAPAINLGQGLGGLSGGRTRCREKEEDLGVNEYSCNRSGQSRGVQYSAEHGSDP